MLTHCFLVYLFLVLKIHLRYKSILKHTSLISMNRKSRTPINHSEKKDSGGGNEGRGMYKKEIDSFVTECSFEAKNTKETKEDREACDSDFALNQHCEAKGINPNVIIIFTVTG